MHLSGLQGASAVGLKNLYNFIPAAAAARTTMMMTIIVCTIPIHRISGPACWIRNAASQAREMEKSAENAGHFQVPDSRFMVTSVAVQGI